MKFIPTNFLIITLNDLFENAKFSVVNIGITTLYFIIAIDGYWIKNCILVKNFQRNKIKVEQHNQILIHKLLKTLYFY